jgi:hypothetical protein
VARRSEEPIRTMVADIVQENRYVQTPVKRIIERQRKITRRVNGWRTVKNQ